MIFTIFPPSFFLSFSFFFFFSLEAPRYLPLDQSLGHLFLKRVPYTRAFTTCTLERRRVDWYGNKPVAGNFLFFFFFFFFLRPCWRWEGGGEHGIDVPRRMFGEIFYAFYGIIAYLRVGPRGRATLAEKATGISESSRRLFALRFVPTWQRLNARLLFDVVRGFYGILTPFSLSLSLSLEGGTKCSIRDA